MSEEEVFCRICHSTEKELAEDPEMDPRMYTNVGCDCKGSMGNICHSCLKREYIDNDKRDCSGCKQLYRNVERNVNLKLNSFTRYDHFVAVVAVLYVFLRVCDICSYLLAKNPLVDIIMAVIALYLMLSYTRTGQLDIQLDGFNDIRVTSK